MIKRGQTLLIAALFASAAPFAFAEFKDNDAQPVLDSARPAIGEWVGQVSWNTPIVAYAWRIDPDGAFSSGRLGRSYAGGGVWNANGAHLTLKYADGFRYEGEVSADTYSGTAYLADGREFGEFSMWRSVETDKSRLDANGE